MLDYINCNIQAHILCVINANNTILFLYVIYDNSSLHALHKAFVFLMGIISHELFSQFVVARIHFCLMMVYYLYIYTTLQNI